MAPSTILGVQKILPISIVPLLSKLPKTRSPTESLLQNPPLSSSSSSSSTSSTDLKLHAGLLYTTSALSLSVFLDPHAAIAVGGDLGILEGRTFALIHPAMMAGLFFYTLWAGYLGWQWRRVRTIQGEINNLKKQIPDTAAPEPAAVASGSQTAAQAPPPSSPVLVAIEAKIQKLTEERKALLKGNFKDQHFHAGSVLLGVGVLESVGGGMNTWFRTGKLFPGPHLFAGAGITVLWALAAALVPAMQKGNEAARNLHIALNMLNVLLFIWQIPTGIDIVLKVFEFTKWP